MTYPGFYDYRYYGRDYGGGSGEENYIAYVGDVFYDNPGSDTGFFPFAYSDEEILFGQGQSGQKGMLLGADANSTVGVQHSLPNPSRISVANPRALALRNSGRFATEQALAGDPSPRRLGADESGETVATATVDEGEEEASGFWLFGEEWVWPWTENAAGFWDSLGAYGRAASRAAAGTASGAIAGAGTGALAGGATGLVVSGGPGVVPGAAAGAAGGAIWGGVSGLLRAAVASDAKDAAIGGAKAGAIGGALGGAGRAYGTVRGLRSAAGAVRATAHGYQRLLERSWTLAEYNAVKAGGRMLTQADGATVYILEVAPGKFNVLIENPATGKVISAFKHISKKSLDGLARNYGWH
ncbi:Flagellar hook-length control protein FliK [Thermogutta terrifontis]|uniref:Flagellar hook-length control protein FliK n=1 Tax=Thermogutta terrifontis TaxID=1331910 RepID=A0A286RCA4_9BACT|nr:Flagellar hook-length control protein FliK [Thermogutta terrifontis]